MEFFKLPSGKVVNLGAFLLFQSLLGQTVGAFPGGALQFDDPKDAEAIKTWMASQPAINAKTLSVGGHS